MTFFQQSHMRALALIAFTFFALTGFANIRSLSDTQWQTRFQNAVDEQMLSTGRQNLMTVLIRDGLLTGSLSESRRKRAEALLTQAYSRFFSRDAQTFYLKSDTLYKKKMYQQAHVLVRQSIGIESDNWMSLELKSSIEKMMNLYELREETIKTKLLLIPFHIESLEQLTSQLLYTEQFNKIIERSMAPAALSSVTLERALAFSFLQTGKTAQALRLFRKQSKKPKQYMSIEISYGLGLCLAKTHQPLLAKPYLEAFLRQLKSIPLDSWDPYKLQDHKSEVVQALLALQSKAN